MIDGKIVPSISGETFETKSPVDGAVLASVARGNAEDIDRAATAAAQAFKSWRDMPAAARKKLLHRVADAIEDRADDIAVLECIDTGQAHRFMAKAAIRAAENFRFFADRCAGGPRRPQHAERGALEHLDPRADRPGRRHHAVEHAVHAVDLEDRAGAGGRLHRRAQAGGMVAGDGRPAGETGEAGRRARRRAQHRARHRRRSRQGADRTSRHQGDRLRRRKLDRLGDHGAGRADAEARAFRTRRQEPGDRVRRCRSRPRARCRRVHDLLAQWRALHLVEPPAGPARHRRKVHREAHRAGEGAEGRPSARSRHRNRAADPRAASGKGLLLFRRRAEGRRHHRRRRQAA